MIKIMDKDMLKILDEVFGEVLKEEKDKHLNASQVLKMYKPENQITFKDSEFKSPVKLANAIIDLQNHIMVTNSVRLNDETLSKNEKKVLIEHLTELLGWIEIYLLDCIEYIAKNLSNEDEYANKSKEELIEELKKLKGE